MTRLEMKKRFLHQLAVFLVGDQAKKSILLEMPTMVRDLAEEWAALRDETPLFGYPTVEEAEEILTEFLG